MKYGRIILLGYISEVIYLKPNYKQLGFSDCMGPILRQEVEKQLLEDLKYYIKINTELKFDWSESCVEGTRIHYLDGEVEDFSSIRLFDLNDQIFVEGWMNFFYEKKFNLFLVYWDILDIHIGDKVREVKNNFGMPEHINNEIKKKKQLL